MKQYDYKLNNNSQFVEVIPFNDNLMLSLKSMWIYSHIQTQLLDILGVHSIHVEAGALIPRNEVTH